MANAFTSVHAGSPPQIDAGAAGPAPDEAAGGGPAAPAGGASEVIQTRAAQAQPRPRRVRVRCGMGAPPRASSEGCAETPSGPSSAPAHGAASAARGAPGGGELAPEPLGVTRTPQRPVRSGEVLARHAHEDGRRILS